MATVHKSKLRIGGIHGVFSAPILFGVENNFYKDRNLNVEWITYPDTGSVSNAIAEGLIDIGILPTETFLFDACRFHFIQALGTYINSPLNWAIYVKNSSGNCVSNMSQLRNKIFGTRGGISTTVLRTKLEAYYQGWIKTENNELKQDYIEKVHPDWKVLERYLDNGTIDALLWDCLQGIDPVKEGRWNVVHTRAPEWPSYIVAIATPTLEKEREVFETLSESETSDSYNMDSKISNRSHSLRYRGGALLTIQPDTYGHVQYPLGTKRSASLHLIHTFFELTKEICNINFNKENKNKEYTVQWMSKYYKLSYDTSMEWLTTVHWSIDMSCNSIQIKKAIDDMYQAKILGSKPLLSGLFHLACQVTVPLEYGSEYDWRIKSLDASLNALGIHKDDAIPVEVLQSFGHLEQYHYLGNAACNDIIMLLGLNKGLLNNKRIKLLDAGCGIGGPCRYFSAKCDENSLECHGVDVQKSLIDKAKELSLRCGFKTVQNQFSEFDLTSGVFKPNHFHHLVMQQVLYHFENRKKTLNYIFQSLVSGATFVIEDFFTYHPLGWVETRILKNVLHGYHVTSINDIISDLEAAGAVDIEVVDISAEWKTWVTCRSEQLLTKIDSVISLIGEELAEERRFFYDSVCQLFKKNRIGGARITGRKKVDNSNDKDAIELWNRLQNGRNSFVDRSVTPLPFQLEEIQ